MNKPTLVFLTAIVALSSGLGVYLLKQPQGVDNAALQPLLQASTLLPAGFKSLPDMTMTDQDGAPFGRDRFQGDWHMLFFGYTHCPDVCPITMTVMDKVVQNLSAQSAASPLKVTFVSVDPQRDTPEHLKKYMAFFNPDFIGLTPDPKTLPTLSTELGVVYQRMENPHNPQGYLMDHTASLMLASPDGQIVALFSAPHDPEKIAADVALIRAAFEDA